jgi:glutaredoxin
MLSDGCPHCSFARRLFVKEFRNRNFTDEELGVEDEWTERDVACFIAGFMEAKNQLDLMMIKKEEKK